jgi:PadR family transcriptional regulator
MDNESNIKHLESMIQDIRRGTLVLAILSQLAQEHYGYSLREELARQGHSIKEGTLYPLLRRLESQGLLTSRWEIADNRNRRYYRLSVTGRDTYHRLRTEWHILARTMDGLLSDGDTSKSGNKGDSS